jgi:hypothetical protein
MSPLVPYTEKGVNFSVKKESNQPSQHLLYSVNNEIRLHHDGDNREYLIAERPGPVDALAIHRNRLVHAEHVREGGLLIGRILYTEDEELIAERHGCVGALTDYNGRLVDAGDCPEILYTEDKGPIADRVIARRRGSVYSLAIYRGRLIDASGGGIRYTETDGQVEPQSPECPSITQEIIRQSSTYPVTNIARKEKYFVFGTRCLVLGGDRLIRASNYMGENEQGAHNSYLSRINHADTGEPIAERPDWVRALAEYKGRLIDAGDYFGIINTATGKAIVETDYTVNSLLPINDETTDRLLTLPEVREII